MWLSKHSIVGCNPYDMPPLFTPGNTYAQPTVEDSMMKWLKSPEASKLLGWAKAEVLSLFKKWFPRADVDRITVQVDFDEKPQSHERNVFQ